MNSSQDISALIARVEEVLEPFAKATQHHDYMARVVAVGSSLGPAPDSDFMATIPLSWCRKASAILSDLRSLHSQTEGGDDAAK